MMPSQKFCQLITSYFNKTKPSAKIYLDFQKNRRKTYLTINLTNDQISNEGSNSLYKLLVCLIMHIYRNW